MVHEFAIIKYVSIHQPDVWQDNPLASFILSYILSHGPCNSLFKLNKVAMTT